MLYIFLKCLSRIHYSPHRALERTAFQQPLHLYNESNHKKVTRHPIIFFQQNITLPQLATYHSLSIHSRSFSVQKTAHLPPLPFTSIHHRS